MERLLCTVILIVHMEGFMNEMFLIVHMSWLHILPAVMMGLNNLPYGHIESEDAFLSL